MVLQFHSLYSPRQRPHDVKNRPEMLTALGPILVIHTASASAISAIEQRLVAIHAEPGRKSAMKPNLNARTVIAADLHALAMGQSLLKLKRDPTPTVALRCHCNRRYMMRPFSRLCHCQQTVLVMTIGVASRQLQRLRNHTLASLSRCMVHSIPDIIKAAIIGEAPHGSIEIRIARMVPTTLLHQSTTTSPCNLPHILSLEHPAIYGDLRITPHISLVVSQP
jgi:hypothetical protein